MSIRSIAKTKCNCNRQYIYNKRKDRWSQDLTSTGLLEAVFLWGFINNFIDLH